MRDIKAKVLSNENIGSGYFKMSLEAPSIAKSAKPGQFMQVRCSDTLEPFLRRPFSVHRLKAKGSRFKGIEILYEVIGKGTEILSKKRAEEFLDVLGPLGNGFILPKASSLQPSAILIAGGIGVAPLVFLAEVLAKKKIKATVLIGAKTKKMLLCEKDFKKLGAEIRVATDDGSKGFKGVVSKLFEKILRNTKYEIRDAVYSCGPQPMLKSIATVCAKHKIKCYASLEEEMACGIGACLGCAVRVKGKGIVYKFACKDGPIFDTKDIIWEM